MYICFMEYLITNRVPQNFQQVIENINNINFEKNANVIMNEIFIISLNDMQENFPNRFLQKANNTFGIEQSFYNNENKVHLIIINIEMIREFQVNLIAVILHELGHIVNEFERILTTLEGISRGMTSEQIKNEKNRIKLENEFHADFFVKKYGFMDDLINNLQLSLNRGLNDEELNQRIIQLESDVERITNNVRQHNI